MTTKYTFYNPVCGYNYAEKESVAITLTGGQGSMKTRFCFQLMNALAQNYKVGHASIEEHPESGLYFDKVEQYLNGKSIHNIILRYNSLLLKMV
jgi:type IV secretory pathway ATPase VirB11/archaellum biosynthesis ATPase